MKQLTAILLVLAVTGCASVKTPQERYFATLTAATATLNVAQGYADQCLLRSTDDPCYTVLPKMGVAIQTVKKAKDQADKVFVTEDSQYYDLSLTATENATKGLKDLIKEFAL